jgi:resolvase, N terminal domain
MARYAYIRVSTDRQSYDQQIQDIKAYGINLDELDGITEEKMTTNRGYEDRAFNSLLKNASRATLSMPHQPTE